MSASPWRDLGQAKARADGSIMVVVSRLASGCCHWALFCGPAADPGTLLASGYEGCEPAAEAATVRALRRSRPSFLQLVR